MSELVGNAVDWIREHCDRPWLVCGKGPSFRADHPALPDFHRMTLNHACQFVTPTIAHFIDLEPLLASRPTTPIAIPWVPNVDFAPADRPLPELLQLPRWKKLTRLLKNGQLYCYNRQQAGRARNPRLPTISARYFSAEGAFGLLAAAGVNPIYSMGVDGGTDYASCFDRRDRLANGLTSFDRQMPEIKRLLAAKQIRWARLNSQVTAVA